MFSSTKVPCRFTNLLPVSEVAHIRGRGFLHQKYARFFLMGVTPSCFGFAFVGFRFFYGFLPHPHYIINENTPLVNSNLPCFVYLYYLPYISAASGVILPSPQVCLYILQLIISSPEPSCICPQSCGFFARSYKRSERGVERRYSYATTLPVPTAAGISAEI